MGISKRGSSHGSQNELGVGCEVWGVVGPCQGEHSFRKCLNLHLGDKLIVKIGYLMVQNPHPND